MKITSQSIPHTYRNKRLKVRAYSLNTPSFTGGTHSHGNLSILDIINSEDIDWVKTLKELIVLDGENIKIDTNLYTTGGITMFGNDGEVDIPTIYDGLPIDGITIFWENGILKAAGGGEVIEITSEMIIAALGYTPLQNIPSEYVTETELAGKGYATSSSVNTSLAGKVDKVTGKQLSTEDFTTALKTKLEGLNNYDDSTISSAIDKLRSDFDTLVSGDTTTAIKSFNDIVAFLDGLSDTEDLDSIIASIEQQIAAKQDIISDLATIREGAAKGATALQSIPSEYVTETELTNKSYATTSYVSTELGKKVDAVSGKGLSTNDYTTTDKNKLAGIASGAEVNVQSDWNVTDSSSDAFIKNKPTIPSAVTESTVSGWGFTKNTGTYSKPSGGIPKTDLENSVQTSLGKADTALQSHQDISGKQDKLVSGTSIKTINGESILGSGDIDTYIEPNRMIVYTSIDSEVVTPYNANAFCANIISNTYKDGKGVMLFDADVTSIGDNAFRACEYLETIVIPESVTSIGNNAFYDCFGLKEINIPDKVQSIGESAFCFTDSLESIIIPSTITTIKKKTFDCSGLRNIVIPESVTNIEEYAFSCCYFIPNITLPNSLQYIGKEAFSCTLFKSIIIPENVISIGDYAFYMSELETVIIKSGAIGSRAFGDCYYIKELYIYDNVTSIGDNTFEYCENLEKVYISENSKLTTIGKNAFGYTRLKSLTIPKSVVSIDNNAFEWLYGGGLEAIYCKATTPPTLGNDVFYCTSISNIYVPYNSLNAYKSASGWNSYANKIKGYHYDTGLLKTINGQSIVGEGDITIKDISGNAASATKLQNSRTIWGQSFDGTGNVDGDMTVTGNILTTGGVTMYSDRRLKTDIQPLKNRGYITPCSYVKDGKREIGFIAQDVQELYPELVKEGEYLSLNYSQMTAILEAQIIELRNEIDDLKKELKQLKAE